MSEFDFCVTVVLAVCHISTTLLSAVCLL